MCSDESQSTAQKLICMAQDERAVEFQNALLAFLLALWWLSPFWNVYDSQPRVYQFMYWLPRPVWGWLLIAIATTQLAALWKNHIWLRKHILLLKGGVWLNLAITVAYGDFTAPSCGIFFFLALNAFRGFLCLHPKKRA